MIAKTPSPPYYAVIFTSVRSDVDNGYQHTDEKMFELATLQDGFLGVETVAGIAVSYWKDLESIKKWKENTEHSEAQKRGKEEWYKTYKMRICKVERDYEFNAPLQ
jgi:heme-degrading monooxygenase HmoA